MSKFKYSRKRLRAFFSAFPPEFKPFSDDNNVCPINFYYETVTGEGIGNGVPVSMDGELVERIDETAEKLDENGDPAWGSLTAGKIVRLIDGLNRKRKSK